MIIIEDILNIAVSYIQANPLGCGLLSVMLIVVLHQLYFYLRYIRKGAKVTPLVQYTDNQSLPGVSVIVCARNEETNLQNYLHTLLNQDYPTFKS